MERSVAGFDLTFKAPKSVGILAGIAPEHLRAALRDCHDTAVIDPLAHLERDACRARRGKDGVVQVRGEGFIAAGFRHRTSRAGDPLLHTHVVVANRTLGPDGRWTALDARPMYKHAKTAGFVYQARLRHEVNRRLGLEWGEVVKGSADVVGFSRELIEHFSTRRAEIVRELALRGITVAHAFVLGSDAAYREWGYTSLSRHRESSTFYITAPRGFPNALNPPRSMTTSPGTRRGCSTPNAAKSSPLKRSGETRPMPTWTPSHRWITASARLPRAR